MEYVRESGGFVHIGVESTSSLVPAQFFGATWRYWPHAFGVNSTQ
jgi:hypothetical protein